jgi:hypothetical protein
VGHATEQPLPTTAHQHDIIDLRKLVQDHLESHDAPASLRIKPLNPRRPVLHKASEAIFRQPVALRSAEEFLIIDIGVTEAGRHGQADLGSTAAHFLGDRQNRHGLILLPSMPSGRASRAERVGRWREHSRAGRRGQGRPGSRFLGRGFS